MNRTAITVRATNQEGKIGQIWCKANKPDIRAAMKSFEDWKSLRIVAFSCSMTVAVKAAGADKIEWKAN
jgi:hypothetical protein